MLELDDRLQLFPVLVRNAEEMEDLIGPLVPVRRILGCHELLPFVVANEIGQGSLVDGVLHVTKEIDDQLRVFLRHHLLILSRWLNGYRLDIVAFISEGDCGLLNITNTALIILGLVGLRRTDTPLA